MAKPREYYLKFVRKGRTYFVDGKTYDKTGGFKFVSKDKVKKSKKSVVEYSVPEHRIKTPEGVETKEIKSDDKLLDKVIIRSDILSQSIKKSILIAVDQSKKIAIKYKGKIHEIKTKTVNQLKSFLDFTDKIQSIYFDTFGKITNSPLFFIGYTEGRNGVVFNYDDTMIGEGGELEDEFPDELKSFRKMVNIQFKKFL